MAMTNMHACIISLEKETNSFVAGKYIISFGMSFFKSREAYMSVGALI